MHQILRSAAFANSLYDVRYDPGLMLERTIYVAPQEGMPLLFPNYTLHEQTPYFGQMERIVAAFNSRALTTMVQPHAEAVSAPMPSMTLSFWPPRFVLLYVWRHIEFLDVLRILGAMSYASGRESSGKFRESEAGREE